MFKVSKYNKYYEYNGKYYVVNLIMWKLLEVDLYTYNLFRSQLQEIEEKDSYKLMKDGIICNENANEYSILNHYYNEAIYENRLNLTILPTTSCNFECAYCYENYKDDNWDEDNIRTLSNFFKKHLPLYQSIKVEWFGGEPLLQKNKLLLISQQIKSISRNLKIMYLGSITTNGFYLDYDTFFNMVQSGIVYFQITLDGDEKNHNKQRPLKSGHGTYDTIFKNLLNIKKFSPKHLYFKIVIRNNLNYEGLLSLEKWISIFRENFGDDSRFSYYPFPISNWDLEKRNTIKNKKYLLKGEINSFGNRNYNSIGQSISNRVCYAAKVNGFSIDPSLNVYKCHHYIQEKCSHLCKDNKLGSIQENGKLSLDKQTLSQWSVRNIDDFCEKCENIPYCLVESCPINDIKPYENCYKKVEDSLFKEIKAQLKNVLGAKKYEN